MSLKIEKLSQLEVLESAEGTHVLVEQNGTHKRVPAAKIVGGPASIDVTATVGQTIVVTEVDANGKPTKWKAADYPLVVNEIIPQTTYTPQLNSSYGAYTWLFENNTKLKAGQKYTVVFDGAKYTCTAKWATVGNMSATYIGNGVVAGDDTGEPFALLGIDGYDGHLVMCNFDGNEHTVSLSVTELHDDYLPQSTFPYYVQVTAEIDLGNGGVISGYFCSETVVNLEEIYKSGRLIVLRLMLSTDVATQWLYYQLSAVVSSAAYPGFVFGFVQPMKTSNNGQPALNLLPQEDGTYSVSDSLS